MRFVIKHFPLIFFGFLTAGLFVSLIVPLIKLGLTWQTMVTLAALFIGPFETGKAYAAYREGKKLETVLAANEEMSKLLSDARVHIHNLTEDYERAATDNKKLVKSVMQHEKTIMDMQHRITDQRECIEKLRRGEEC